MTQVPQPPRRWTAGFWPKHCIHTATNPVVMTSHSPGGRGRRRTAHQPAASYVPRSHRRENQHVAPEIVKVPAITELAESKAGDQTIVGIAGHVSKKMFQHYSRVRMGAKRSALDALSMKPVQVSDSRGTTAGYDTSNDTKMRHGMERLPQVVESLVEHTVSSKPLSGRHFPANREFNKEIVGFLGILSWA